MDSMLSKLFQLHASTTSSSEKPDVECTLFLPFKTNYLLKMMQKYDLAVTMTFSLDKWCKLVCCSNETRAKEMPSAIGESSC